MTPLSSQTRNPIEVDLTKVREDLIEVEAAEAVEAMITKAPQIIEEEVDTKEEAEVTTRTISSLENIKNSKMKREILSDLIIAEKEVTTIMSPEVIEAHIEEKEVPTEDKEDNQQEVSTLEEEEVHTEAIVEDMIIEIKMLNIKMRKTMHLLKSNTRVMVQSH